MHTKLIYRALINCANILVEHNRQIHPRRFMGKGYKRLTTKKSIITASKW